MYRILPLLFCLTGAFSAFAQEPAKATLTPCGTPTGISPWLRTYAATQHNNGIAERSEDTLWVGLQLHLLARDNGTGRFPNDRALDAFCRLNADFAASNIQFYFKDDINLIDNTGWFAHTTIPQGIDMMLTNNVDDAFNAYFVSNPAGNCGYNLPYGGVAIGHSCASATDHTWAHEAGHALSLPHPFIGWEGKNYNFSVPTPMLLTYDYTYFHDTLDTQIPAPLDTALVEYVDGSNCGIAADLICDSRPDYLSYRWNCNNQSMSSVKQKDPDGAEFYSDGTLFMSYADDACQTRFTPGEIAAMRANLMSEKANWVAPAVLASPVVALPTTIEPVQDQPVPISGTQLRWTSVPNATHYLVQASRFSSFVVREVDMITTDTSVMTSNLIVNKQYHWRVKAFNNWHPCADFTESATFLSVALTTAYSPDWEGWRCYPSLLTAGQALQMEIPDTWLDKEAQLRIFDVSGRLVASQQLSLHSSKMRLNLSSEGWQSGLYHLVLTSDKGLKRQPLFIN